MSSCQLMALVKLSLANSMRTIEARILSPAQACLNHFLEFQTELMAGLIGLRLDGDFHLGVGPDLDHGFHEGHAAAVGSEAVDSDVGWPGPTLSSLHQDLSRL